MALSIPIITEYVGTGLDKFKQELSQAETNSQKAGLVIRKAFIPATLAIGAMATVLVDSVNAALEDKAAAGGLALSLKKTTTATDDQIKANSDFIDSLMLATNTADDELRPAMARLSRSTGDVTKAQELLALAVDISKGSGKDLDSVVSALAKGYDGNTQALGRLGLGLDQSLIRSKDFNAIQEQLTTTFGGFAQEMGKTTEGQLARFTLGIAELKEGIGAALLPVIDAVLPYLNRFADWAQNNPGTFLAIAGAIGAIAGSVIAVNIAMALNPFALIAGGIAALVAGLVIAYHKFEWFKKIVDAVFEGLKWYIGMAKDNFLALVGIFKTVFNGLASAWNNTIGKFNFKVPSWVPGLGGQGFDMPNIPMLADGGIVTAPTLALIGEAGPEAVVPLDRMGAMGAPNVTINVQGADPNAVVDALRTYMFRNGAVPIRVA